MHRPKCIDLSNEMHKCMRCRTCQRVRWFFGLNAYATHTHTHTHTHTYAHAHTPPHTHSHTQICKAHLCSVVGNVFCLSRRRATLISRTFLAALLFRGIICVVIYMYTCNFLVISIYFSRMFLAAWLFHRIIVLFVDVQTSHIRPPL